jgi:hypothetical protein
MKPSFEARGLKIWCNPTPGGIKNDDGSTTYGLTFPIFQVNDAVMEPAKIAKELERLLNEHWGPA